MNAYAIAAVTGTVFFTLWALFSPPQRAIPRALSACIAAFVLIPTFGPPRMVSALPLLIAVATLLIAILRSSTQNVRRVNVLVVFLFIAFYSMTSLANDSLLSVGLVLIRGLALILVSYAVTKLPVHGYSTVIRTVIMFVPVQLGVAVLEQFRVIPYVWARRETAAYLDISTRDNELVSSLVGRSMGTLGHPILLGLFAAVALVLSIVCFAASRRWTLLLVALASASILALSGTRSAAVAALAGLVIWLLLRPGRRFLVRLFLAVAATVVALNYERVVGAVLSDGVVESISYVHRTRVLSSIPNLLSREDLSWLFGSGAASVPELFSSGFVSGYGSFAFFDNMYVSVLAVSGVVGLVLLAIVVVRGFVIGNGPTHAVLTSVLVMMASFDAFTWDFSFVVFILAVSGPLSLEVWKRNEPAASSEVASPPTGGDVVRFR